MRHNKLYWLVFIAFCGFLTGCTFEADVQPLVLPATVTLPPVPTATEIILPVAPTLTQAAPAFSRQIQFAADLDAASFQRTFAPQTKRVYALWEYVNMQAGLLVRREWYLDGTLWLVREEPWDFAKYGASGRVTDISIYDLDQGLPSGRYQLRLYISGQPQFDLGTDSTQIEFSIEGGIVSPDGNYLAVVLDPQTLQIQDRKGNVISQFKLNDIFHPVWFPDNLHLVFSDRDHSQQMAPPATAGIRHKLYLANIQTGELRELASLDENLHSPIISPDGRKLALYKGDNWFDACFVNTELVFMELDADFNRVRLTSSKDFDGIAKAGESIYPLSLMYSQLEVRWLDNSRFKTALSWTCVYENDPSGYYIFDLNTSQAERVGEVVLP